MDLPHCLYTHFSEGFFEQRQRLLEEGDLSHPRFRYAHEFAAADRIVLAAPFWDLSFPALVKIYIENVSVDGITFGCNESGCFGTCRAEKLMYITTRGGSYTGGVENCRSYQSSWTINSKTTNGEVGYRLVMIKTAE